MSIFLDDGHFAFPSVRLIFLRAGWLDSLADIGFNIGQGTELRTWML
jgi:hypothetical protein